MSFQRRTIQLARTAYDRQFGGDQAGGVPYNKAVDIGSFPGLVGTSFASLLRQDSLPVIDRARIWAWAPEDLRQRAWPEIGAVLADHARQAGFDPDLAFPPPVVPEPDAVADATGE